MDKLRKHFVLWALVVAAGTLAASTSTKGGWWWLAAVSLGLAAIALGAWALVVQTLHGFEKSFGRVRAKLPNVDWFRAASDAVWPRRLYYRPQLSLSRWLRYHVTSLRPADLRLLEIARGVYASNPGFREEDWHAKERRKLRETADMWAGWFGLPGWLLFFFGNAIRQKRNELLVLVYLELALAERIANDDGADLTAGPASEFVRLGDQWPSLLGNPDRLRANREIPIPAPRALPVQTAPLPSLSIDKRDLLWYGLVLTNNGRQGTFRVEMRVVDANTRYPVDSSFRVLEFQADASRSVTLPTGASEWIRFARTDLVTLFCYNAWSQDTSVFLEAKDFPDDVSPFVIVEVRVLSEPPAPVPHVRRIRYERPGLWERPYLALAPGDGEPSVAVRRFATMSDLFRRCPACNRDHMSFDPTYRHMNSTGYLDPAWVSCADCGHGELYDGGTMPTGQSSRPSESE